MSEKAKENVHKAMKELNYHRNDLAISLFYNRTYIIGLILYIENICTSDQSLAADFH
ncbi:LacI family DNA-binding transcriptional regulator [Clostridium estertheticum]|uniref:LacI family DNA-binding transcriptional regulator n=1 Tax=Clostridium estertheticum TaxID=238834 RepID=UPI001C0D0160|nr:LacI family DNA-binding transcriptional regulator [Clostridium estertheticum]MBU3218376.1 LacI family DNA-binding transcriptional regulator [Clostridium estertheticum]WAG57918.1 LacI family DNA-binding transcriptional regulator [Clostridium estertheticum]